MTAPKPKPKRKAYRYPHPDKPGVFVSRQRLYQLRRVAEDKCMKCGRPLENYAVYCDDHYFDHLNRYVPRPKKTSTSA